MSVKLLEANSEWKIFNCEVEKLVHVDSETLVLSLIDGVIQAKLKDIIIDSEKNIHFICADDKEFLLSMDETFPCIRVVEK